MAGRLALQMTIQLFTPGCTKWNTIMVTPNPWKPTSLQRIYSRKFTKHETDSQYYTQSQEQEQVVHKYYSKMH